MKRWLLSLLFLAGCISATASAQQWALYVSPERDFRILMPALPVRTAYPDGSVEYRADFGRLQYYVYRRDPSLNTGSPRSDISRRLSRGDIPVTDVGGNEGALPPNEFVFMWSGVQSMHRIVAEPGHYYELVVITSDLDSGLNRLAVSDYFSTFDLTGGGSFAGKSIIPTVDSCNAYASTLGRLLCQYVACAPSAAAAHPVCTSLPRLWR